jgi:hypothetical protein
MSMFGSLLTLLISIDYSSADREPEVNSDSLILSPQAAKKQML